LFGERPGRVKGASEGGVGTRIDAVSLRRRGYAFITAAEFAGRLRPRLHSGYAMRRIRLYLFAACTLFSLSGALPSFAQYGPGGGGGGGPDDQQQEEDAKRRKRDEEFGGLNAPLPQLRNAGPCPYVKVLYDAARYIDFKDKAEASAAVINSGEIETVASTCEYRAAEPIKLKMKILFELGRGPQAMSRRKDYHYWIAVTDRNRAVLDKQEFVLPVDFPAGSDRVTVTESLDSLIIPRHDSKVSGANFEILVGFDVTPEMAEFNREGKRFRPNAGQVEAEAAPSKP